MSDVTTDTMMHSVAAGITVDIAEEGFDRVSALLAGIPGGANRAVGSAPVSYTHLTLPTT